MAKFDKSRRFVCANDGDCIYAAEFVEGKVIKQRWDDCHMTDRQLTLPVPLIDANRCTGCGLCIRVCPTNVLTMRGDIAIVANPQACTYAGHCERICPAQAIHRPFQVIFIHREEIQ